MAQMRRVETASKEGYASAAERGHARFAPCERSSLAGQVHGFIVSRGPPSFESSRRCIDRSGKKAVACIPTHFRKKSGNGWGTLTVNCIGTRKAKWIGTLTVFSCRINRLPNCFAIV
jgi:hypothetical protein